MNILLYFVILVNSQLFEILNDTKSSINIAEQSIKLEFVKMIGKEDFTDPNYLLYAPFDLCMDTL